LKGIFNRCQEELGTPAQYDQIHKLSGRFLVVFKERWGGYSERLTMFQGKYL
jgi:hypothetical protein